ncbi:hypothetical protein [Marinomonas balearica]|uniref:General secretion pathway protein N n=1 Tax=Marinomonas balearica TaxID=491947 RepID=A0A4R6M5W4_9GAMM|nr:hypothetical protein [Marinomonas balearica]TDO96205.1 hypothetical protein DFP79_2777 [Marinomonas balearica]
MISRRVITHTIWVALVLCASVAWYLPLNYWYPLIQGVAPASVSIQSLDGHWWQGKARLTIPNLKGSVDISWNGLPFLKQADVQAEHNRFQILGDVQATTEGFLLNIDYARINADIANSALSAQKVGLSGMPIYLDKWQLNWEWGAMIPVSVFGEGKWDSGSIFFKNGNRSQQANVDHWQLLASTSAKQPRFGLLNASSEKMIDVKTLENNEVELSIMPSFLKELGIKWNGDPSYPAFVLVQPIGFTM